MGVLAGIQVPGPRLAFIAHRAGMPLENLVMCLAIGKAESLWYDRAYNDNDATFDRSYGIWQINMRGDLEADRLRRYNLRSVEDLYDPSVNARIMVSMFRDRGWQPWGAYHDGNYRSHVNSASAAVTTYTQRLQESGSRLHLDGPDDCDRI